MTNTFVIANIVAQSHLEVAYSAFPNAPVLPVAVQASRLQRLTAPLRRPAQRFAVPNQQPVCS